jgi:hypothetical protein
MCFLAIRISSFEKVLFSSLAQFFMVNTTFLNHSSVVGHPGYFHNLAIVNSAAINMAMLVILE